MYRPFIFSARTTIMHGSYTSIPDLYKDSAVVAEAKYIYAR